MDALFHLDDENASHPFGREEEEAISGPQRCLGEMCPTPLRLT